MNKEREELMQKRVIGEDIRLSVMIADIVPVEENKFTNLELEVEKKHEFSLVVYKKQKPLQRLVNKVKFIIERIKIMKKSREYETNKNV